MAGLLGNFKNPLASGGLLSDPMVRLQMGAAMMGGQTLGQQIGGGLQAAGVAKQAQQEAAKRNQTIEWLKTINPELAQAAEMGAIDINDAYGQVLEARKPKQPDWMNAGDGRFYSPSLDEWRSAPVDPNARPPLPDYGNTPIPMYDENGNYTIGQLGSDNTANPVKLPKGWRVGDPYEFSFQRASGAAAGKDQGETVATYESVMSKMPGLEKVVTELNGLADQATYTMGGNLWNEALKQTGFGPSAGAVARTKYMSMVDNQVLPLLKDTFGAAFTATEGESLRATLGDPNKTPEEKKMVLEAFIEQKRRDANALADRTGNAPYQPAPGSLAAMPQAGAPVGSAQKRLRYNPATGELE